MTQAGRPASAGVVVRYEPRGAAAQLMIDRSPEILIAGAAGTGKSLAMLYKLHLTCLYVPGLRALLVRQTHASLTGTTLVTFERAVVLKIAFRVLDRLRHIALVRDAALMAEHQIAVIDRVEPPDQLVHKAIFPLVCTLPALASSLTGFQTGGWASQYS